MVAVEDAPAAVEAPVSPASPGRFRSLPRPAQLHVPTGAAVEDAGLPSPELLLTPSMHEIEEHLEALLNRPKGSCAGKFRAAKALSLEVPCSSEVEPSMPVLSPEERELLLTPSMKQIDDHLDALMRGTAPPPGEVPTLVVGIPGRKLVVAIPDSEASLEGAAVLLETPTSTQVEQAFDALLASGPAPANLLTRPAALSLLAVEDPASEPEPHVSLTPSAREVDEMFGSALEAGVPDSLGRPTKLCIPADAPGAPGPFATEAPLPKLHTPTTREVEADFDELLATHPPTKQPLLNRCGSLTKVPLPPPLTIGKDAPEGDADSPEEGDENARFDVNRAEPAILFMPTPSEVDREFEELLSGKPSGRPELTIPAGGPVWEPPVVLASPLPSDVERDFAAALQTGSALHLRIPDPAPLMEPPVLFTPTSHQVEEEFKRQLESHPPGKPPKLNTSPTIVIPHADVPSQPSIGPSILLTPSAAQVEAEIESLLAQNLIG